MKKVRSGVINMNGSAQKVFWIKKPAYHLKRRKLKYQNNMKETGAYISMFQTA